MSDGSTLAARVATAIVRFTLRIFFRRIEVTGLENVPTTGGGLLVSWHPNALIDPALILTSIPRPVVFGARHGLFAWPLLGTLMRALGTVPIYRQEDSDAREDPAVRRARNDESLDALADAILDGAYAVLFPEGDSHDEPAPTELRSGAARLYYRALARTPPGSSPPAIVPVGLHYDKKQLFGSNALVAFHPPLSSALLAVPDSAGSASREARVRELTLELTTTLHSVVHATESWTHHHALHRIRTLMRAERAHRAGASPGKPDMKERVLAFERIRDGYEQTLRSDPERMGELFDRTLAYDSLLTELGIRDHEIDRAPSLATPGLALLLVLQAMIVYLVLPLILVAGAVVNFPAGAAVWAVSKLAARRHKDVASIKLITGLVAFPLTWVGVGLLVGFGRSLLPAYYPSIPNAPFLTGLLAFVLSALGAYVALNYQRFARLTLRSIRVRLTRLRRARTLAHLRTERGELLDAFMELGKDLDLPGRVAVDGRIVASD